MGGSVPRRTTKTRRPHLRLVEAGPDDDRVVCRTPTPDRKPTRIERWKFESVRGAILDAVEAEEDGLPFGDLARAVGERLMPEELQYLGSIGWYTTTVKLELEVAGELRRETRGGRQVLLRP